MVEIKDKTKCCGCTACTSVCPKQCIEMIEDEEGFLYPKVEIDQCLKCGICEIVCPMYDNKIEQVKSTSMFAGQSVNDDIRNISTAGGIVAEIIDYAYKNNYCIYAVGYNNMLVTHKKVLSVDDQRDVAGSKYVQSNLDGIFRNIKKEINRGEKVLFVGTPCQVHGLTNVIGRNENLITIDLLCLGVSSPRLFKEWINYLSEKYKDKVIRVEFRNKRYGYATPNVRVLFQNRKAIEQKYDARVHSQMFFRFYNIRPSCYKCKFREISRASDITVGDFHNIKELFPEMDDDIGTTRVWVHTKKGVQIYSVINNAIRSELIESCGSNIVGGSSEQIHVPKDRKAFFEDANCMDYYTLISKWFPKGVEDSIIEIARPIVNKLPFKKIVFQKIRDIRTLKFENNTRK